MNVGCVRFKKYIFNDRVAIMDTWGWTIGNKRSNYPFEAILDGKVKDDHHVHSQVSQFDPADNSRIIDAVLFVVGGDIISNPSVVVEMRKFYNIALRRRIPVFFAVTKIDLWFLYMTKENLLLKEDFRHSATRIHQSNTWRNFLQFIQKNIEDPEAVILPIINYDHCDTFVNPLIEFLAMEFTKVLTKRIEQHYRTAAEDEKDGEVGPDGLMLERIEQQQRAYRKKAKERKKESPSHEIDDYEEDMNRNPTKGEELEKLEKRMQFQEEETKRIIGELRKVGDLFSRSMEIKDNELNELRSTCSRLEESSKRTLYENDIHKLQFHEFQRELEAQQGKIEVLETQNKNLRKEVNELKKKK